MAVDDEQDVNVERLEALVKMRPEVRQRVRALRKLQLDATNLDVEQYKVRISTLALAFLMSRLPDAGVSQAGVQVRAEVCCDQRAPQGAHHWLCRAYARRGTV